MSTTMLDAPPADESTPPDHWFARLGRFSVRRRRPVMLLWLIAALAAAPLAISVSGALSGAGWEAQGSIAQRVRDELRTDFPQVGAEAAVVVVHQATPISSDPAAIKAIVQRSDRSQGSPGSGGPAGHAGQRRADLAGRPHRARPRGARRDHDAQLPESAGLVIDRFVLDASRRRSCRGDRRVGGVERLQRRQRTGPAQGRAALGSADADLAVRRVRLGDRRRPPAAPRGRRDRRRVRGAAPAHRSHRCRCGR